MPGLDTYTKDVALNFVGNFTELEKQLKEKASEVQGLAEQISALSKDYAEKSDKSAFEQMATKFVKSSMSVVKSGWDSAINEFSNSISFFASSVKLVKNIVSGDLSSIVEMFVKGISNAFSKMNEMIEYSQMTNAEIREMKLSFGLSDSEAFSMSTMNDIMGLQGIEDMLWMNQQQWELYRSGMDRLEDVYLSAFETDDLAEAMYEWQINMKVLEIEFLKPFITLISNNEGLIEKFINTIIDLLPRVVEFLNRLAEGKGIMNALGAFRKEWDTGNTANKYLENYQGNQYEQIAQSSISNKNYMPTYNEATEIHNNFIVNSQTQELNSLQELENVVHSENVRQGKLADI